MTVPYAGFCLAAKYPPKGSGRTAKYLFSQRSLCRYSQKGTDVRADPPNGTGNLPDRPHALSSLHTECPASIPR